MPEIGERRYRLAAVPYVGDSVVPGWPAGPMVMEEWNGAGWIDVPDPTPVAPPDPEPTVMACSVSPTWSFWRWLGFGHPYVRVPAELEEAEGWSPGCSVQDVAVYVDWLDRLRVLVSGKVMVQVSTQMDVMPGRMRSWSDFRVLPPSYKFAKPEDDSHA